MYVGLATAWNIMGGYTGYISLGHAAFFGFGAYAFGLVLAHLGIAGGYEPFLFVPVAGVLTAILALGIGWVALRTRAATFVIVTIAMMFMVQLLAENLVGTHRRRRGLELSRTAVERRLLQHPFLLRDAADGTRRPRHLVVDPALEVRSGPARDPR